MTEQELTPDLLAKVLIVGAAIYAVVYIWGGLSQAKKYYNMGKGK